MKPCPFCGEVPKVDDPDVLHPTGVLWRLVEGQVHYVRFKDRKLTDKWCYVLNCLECGCEVHGDTKQETIDNWEQRI
jgi:hypothetical protein